MKKRLYLILSFLLLISYSGLAQNEDKAREVILKAVDMIQDSTGVYLEYHAQFTRLFVKEGWIVLKGNKFHRESKRTIEWYDGKNHWSLNRSSRKLKLNMPSEYGNDKDIGVYLQQIRTKYNFALKDSKDSYRITLEAKRNAKVDIKRATVLINKCTNKPTQVKLKWSIFWVTLDIANLRTSNCNDSFFVYNKKKYPNVKLFMKKK